MIETTKFAQEILYCHNLARAKYGNVPPLSLDESLNTLSQHYAEQLAYYDQGLVHNTDRHDTGENLYSMTNMKPTAKNVLNSWVNYEVNMFDFENGGFSSQTGHFTQVVWNGTKKLGVGMARGGDTWYVVCNYWPAGNVHGKFRENVFPPGNHCKTNKKNNLPNLNDYYALNNNDENNFSSYNQKISNDFDLNIYSDNHGLARNDYNFQPLPPPQHHPPQQPQQQQQQQIALIRKPQLLKKPKNVLPTYPNYDKKTYGNEYASLKSDPVRMYTIRNFDHNPLPLTQQPHEHENTKPRKVLDHKKMYTIHPAEDSLYARMERYLKNNRYKWRELLF